MSRKHEVFISYQHEDQMQARGLRLLNTNPNHKTSFIERSFIDPLKNKTDAQIEAALEKEIRNSDAVFVCVGNKTHESNWIPKELEIADKYEKPIVAMRLKDKEDAKDPEFLTQRGVEISDWDPDKINDKVNDAVRAKVQTSKVSSAVAGSGGCG